MRIGRMSHTVTLLSKPQFIADEQASEEDIRNETPASACLSMNC